MPCQHFRSGGEILSRNAIDLGIKLEADYQYSEQRKTELNPAHQPH
jgi:hypothetical protein